MMLDPYTFGSRPCFVTLAAILNENPEYASSVSRAVHNAHRKAQAVADGIADLGLRRELLELLQQKTKDPFPQSPMPEVVRRHAHACLVGIYREHLRETEQAQRRVKANQMRSRRNP